MSHRGVNLLRDRSLRMLNQAKKSVVNGDYDLAAFMAEQAIQLYLKSVIFGWSGEIPRAHALRQLFNAFKAYFEDSSEIERFIADNRGVLIRLEDAYINSRYMPREYEKDETEELVGFAEEAIRFVEVVGVKARD